MVPEMARSGYSTLKDFMRALQEAGKACSICSECGNFIEEGDRKIVIDDTIYCVSDALDLVRQLEPALKQALFEGRLLIIRAKGLVGFCLYQRPPGRS